MFKDGDIKKRLEEARKKAVAAAEKLKDAAESMRDVDSAVKAAQESFKGLREEGLGAAARRASQSLGERLGAAGAQVTKGVHSALSELKSVAEIMKDFRVAFNDLGETLNGLMGRHKKKYKDMSATEKENFEEEAASAVAETVDRRVLVPHLGPDEAALEPPTIEVVRRSVRESLHRDVIASIRANGGINPSDLQTIAKDTTKVALEVIQETTSQKQNEAPTAKPPVPRRPVLTKRTSGRVPGPATIAGDTPSTATTATVQSNLKDRFKHLSPDQLAELERRREVLEAIKSGVPTRATPAQATPVGAKPAPAKAAPKDDLASALKKALDARRGQLGGSPKGGDKPTRPRSGSSGGGWSS